MRFKGLLSITLIILFVGCTSSSGSGSKKIQTSIGDVTWTLANIDPGFFEKGGLETAYYNFSIEVSHSEGIENIDTVKVVLPQSETFTIFNSKTTVYPTIASAKQAIFNCYCWLSSKTQPHILELGTYTVEVMFKDGKQISSSFEIFNPNGVEASPFIYTPEENPSATPQMPAITPLENFTVDDHGLTYNFMQTEPDALYYQLNFFDDIGQFQGSSDLFTTEIGGINTRLAREDLNFVNSPEQYTIVSGAIVQYLRDTKNENGNFISISPKFRRSHYYPEDSGTLSSPNLVISQNVDSSIISGTNVIFDLSKTTDEVDTASDIWYRWDWDDDGVFDTAFSHDLIYERKLTRQGSHTSKLQAINSLGQLRERTTGIYVHPNPNSMYIPIPSASMISIVNSGEHGLYTTQTNPNKLFYIDVKSGDVLAERNTSNYVSDMHLSKDEKFLYVAESRPRVDESGYTTDLITLDSDTLEEINRVNLPHAIYKFEVTTEGIVIGATNETDGGFSGLISYTLNDGTKLNEVYAYFPHSFIVSRDEKIVITFNDSEMEIEYYAVDPETGLTFEAKQSILEDTQRKELKNLRSTDELIVSRFGDIYKLETSPDIKLTKLADLLPDSKRARSHAIDEKNNLLFILTEELELYAYNALSLEFIKTIPTDIDWSYFVFTTTDSIILIGHKYTSAVIYPITHPCPDCAFNQRPSAELVSDKNGTITFIEEINLDASQSFDAETEELKFRWDFDSDGYWDTEYSEAPLAKHTYRVAGETTTTVQVKDEYGLVSEATVTFLVTNDAGDPETVISHIPDVIPFIPYSALFDESRDQIYFTDRTNGVIYTFDISTGKITNQITVGLLPENLAISKDAQYLLVTLPTGDHAEDLSLGARQAGFVAIIDLEKKSLSRFLSVDIDPFKLSLSAEGTLFISGGSGPLYPINVYDFETGNKIPQTDLLLTSGKQASIVIHPNNIHLYFTYRYIGRFVADGPNRFYQQSISRLYPGDTLELSSDGTKLFTQSGLIFETSADFDNALTLVGRFNTENVKHFSISEPLNEILFIDSANTIHRSNLSTGAKLESYSLDVTEPKFIFTTDSEVIVLDQVGSEAKVHRIKRDIN